MGRWELEDVLITGYILVVAVVLVVSSACFGLGTWILLRGGLPAVLPQLAAPQPVLVVPTDTAVVNATPVLTPTGDALPFSVPGAVQTVAVPVPTPSAIPFSTLTPTPPSLSAPLVPSGGVTIVEVNAYDDWVRLKNLGSSPVDLTGWALVSEYGNVTCFLSDLMLASGQELRIWARAQDAGPDDATCGLNVEMWDDDEPGPAVLYNADGRIVDSYPHE